MTRIAILSISVLLSLACSGAPPPEVKSADPPAQIAFQAARDAASRGDSIRAEQYLVAALDQGHPAEKVVPDLVRICAAAGRLRVALRYGEPFVRRHPSAIGLRHLLATVQLAVGRREDALVELREVVRLSPAHAPALFLLGLLERNADPEGARRHLERYLTVRPHGLHAEEARAVLVEIRTQLGGPADRWSEGDHG